MDLGLDQALYRMSYWLQSEPNMGSPDLDHSLADVV